MYSLNFGVDKACAAIYEALAIGKIEQWYADQSLRVHARYNEENGLTAKRSHDLVDTFGKRWEVKADRRAGATGNVFLEHAAVEHSHADYFLIFACGLTYILPLEAVVELKNGPWRNVRGGDDLSALGTLVPLGELINYAI